MRPLSKWMGIVFEVDRELPCGCCNTCVGGSEHRRLFHRILPSKDGRCAHVHAAADGRPQYGSGSARGGGERLARLSGEAGRGCAQAARQSGRAW